MTVIHHFAGNPSEFDYQWLNLPQMKTPEGAENAFTKSVLVGPDDGAKVFAIRYFQIPAGSSSPLHTHAHEHGVVILHGTAKLQVEDSFYEVRANDSVYIPGGELHQFVNTGAEPLGFLCVVIAEIEK